MANESRGGLTDTALDTDIVSEIRTYGGLRDVVRAAVGRQSVELGDWSVHPLGNTLGLATGGLFRVSGSSSTSDGDASWSVVLKSLRPPKDSRHDAFSRIPSHWAYWRREADAFSSNLFTSLDRGLIAPKCYGVHEMGPERVWIWLEDISDGFNGEWPTWRLDFACKHLGLFAGRFLGSVPDHAWLCRDFLRTRVEQAGADAVDILGVGETWSHPALGKHADLHVGKKLVDLWHAAPTLLDALDALPETLLHGDAHRDNLLAPSDTETVAVDWGTMGVGAVGADLADLLFWRVTHLHEEGRVEEEMTRSYLEGLNEVSNVDPDTVRLGTFATCALIGVSRIAWAVSMTLKKKASSIEPVSHWTRACDSIQRLGDEALFLLGASP